MRGALTSWRERNVVRTLVFGAASGLAVGVSFLLPSAALLVFVALIPVLRVTRLGRSAAALAGAIAGVVAYATLFAWLPETLTHFQVIPVAGAWLLFALGVVYHAIQFVLFALGAATIFAVTWTRALRETGRATAMMALGWAAWWVLVEWAFPMAIPWSLGEALSPHRLLRQAADLGGVHGLAFAIVLVNAAVTLGLESTQSASVRRRAIAMAAGVPAVLLAYGGWQIEWARRESAVEVPSLGVAIVQGDIPADASRVEGATVRAWETYERLTNRLLTQSGVSDIEVIVWPETTLAAYLRTDSWYREQLERLTTRSDRIVVVGALDRDGDPPAEFNSAYAFLPPHPNRADALTGLQVYHKVFLLPWAEYVPGGDWLPGLRRYRTTGEFRAGTDRRVFVFDRSAERAAPVLVAPSICAEALKGGWFNPLVGAGASVLLNITDDGWFAGTAAPDLHLQLARMRAVETRRWLVRASNSGISAFIDPTGEIVASLPFGEAGTLSHQLVPSNRLTAYVRFGDWIVWMSLMIVALCVLNWVHRYRGGGAPTGA